MAGDGPLPKPHGTYTPAISVSRALGRLNFAKFMVRKGVGYSGFTCRWEKLPEPGRVRVRWNPGDDMRDEVIEAERDHMLAMYEEALRTDGYPVERSGSVLLVQTKSAPGSKSPTDAPNQRQPVHHEDTGVLVGYWTPEKFIPVD